GVPDRLFEQASQARLREMCDLTPAGIAARARAAVAAKRSAATETPAEVSLAGRT
ncbi:MAG: hypothetical protein H0T49_02850, partial [Chloroflexia bacterium]|nr:hypothetical protein [Chloroflexia bacterium]